MGEHSPLPFHRHELQTLAFIRKLHTTYRAKMLVAFCVGVMLGMALHASQTPDYRSDRLVLPE